MCCITIYDLIYTLFSIKVFLFVTEHEPKTAEKQWELENDGSLSLVAPPCINYMQYSWGHAVPVRICITRESYHQYPWVMSSVPVRVCSTRESYPQYLWWYALPLSHIISTRESYPQYPWGYAVPVSHIISTRESYPQYLWGYAVPVSKFIWMKNEWNFPHGYCISSQVLRMWLTDTDDMTHG